MENEIIGNTGTAPPVDVTPKKKVAKVKQEVPLPPPPPTSEASESDEQIEKQPPKPKRQLTEKQKETLAKGRELRTQKQKQQLEEKAKAETELKKHRESKIVQKAIQIKKKQLKQERIIEPESDDDPEPPKQRGYNEPPKQNRQPRIQSAPPQPKPLNIVFL